MDKTNNIIKIYFLQANWDLLRQLKNSIRRDIQKSLESQLNFQLMHIIWFINMCLMLSKKETRLLNYLEIIKVNINIKF